MNDQLTTLSSTLGSILAQIKKEEGSDAESSILSKIYWDLSFYKDLLDDCIEDGEFEESEKKELQKLAEQIINNATLIAKRDGVVDDQEKEVLGHLIQLLEQGIDV